MKGGMKAEAAIRSLLSQVQKGPQPLDPIVLQLSARDQKDMLTYSKLMETIRRKKISLLPRLKDQKHPRGINLVALPISLKLVLKQKLIQEKGHLPSETHLPKP